MKEADDIQVSDEMVKETERFWESPQKIMNLIDLLFLWEEDKKTIPS